MLRRVLFVASLVVLLLVLWLSSGGGNIDSHDRVGGDSIGRTHNARMRESESDGGDGDDQRRDGDGNDRGARTVSAAGLRRRPFLIVFLRASGSTWLADLMNAIDAPRQSFFVFNEPEPDALHDIERLRWRAHVAADDHKNGRAPPRNANDAGAVLSDVQASDNILIDAAADL